MVVGGEDLKTSLAAAVSAQLHDRGRDLQRVRPDRGGRGVRGASLRPGVGHRGQRPHRRACGSRPGRDPERGAVAGTRGRARRAVDLALRPRARLSRARRADRRAFPGAPAATGRAPLPHRGSRADDRPRHARVPWPARPPAQGLRLPRRARGDRGGAARRCRRSSSAPWLRGAGRRQIRRRAMRSGTASAAAFPSNFPRVVFDADGVCNVCRSYDAIEDARPGLLPARWTTCGRCSRRRRARVHSPLRLPDALQRRQGQHLRPVPAGRDGTVGLRLHARQRLHLGRRQGEHPRR